MEPQTQGCCKHQGPFFPAAGTAAVARQFHPKSGGGHDMHVTMFGACTSKGPIIKRLRGAESSEWGSGKMWTAVMGSCGELPRHSLPKFGGTHQNRPGRKSRHCSATWTFCFSFNTFCFQYICFEVLFCTSCSTAERSERRAAGQHCKDFTCGRPSLLRSMATLLVGKTLQTPINKYQVQCLTK